MARPIVDVTKITKAAFDSTVPTNWKNASGSNIDGGSWWDSTATGNGTSAWDTQTVPDNDAVTLVSFDVTTLFQAIYDNPDYCSAVIIGATGSGTIQLFAGKGYTTDTAKRPQISYDGGADQAITDECTIGNGVGAGSQQNAAEQYVIPDLGTSEATYVRWILVVPEPTTRPTSATLKVYTTQQFGAQDVKVFWLRYPPESAPTLLVPPAAPSGVTASSVTAFGATASWTDNSSTETGFKVQYAPSPYSSWTAFSGSPAAANATTLASGNVLTPGTSYKIRVASTNANGDSAFVESGVFTTTPLTFLRPIADTSNGAWTASSGSDRFAMIDESATNDADYITVSTASTYKARLTTVSDPGVDTDHSVVVRAKGDGSSQLTIALVQGDPTETAIASTTVTPTTSYANYTLTVTSGQAANITDYSLLYLKLTSL
jgi:hypothetical protein